MRRTRGLATTCSAERLAARSQGSCWRVSPRRISCAGPRIAERTARPPRRFQVADDLGRAAHRRTGLHGGKMYFPQSADDSFDGCIVRANPNDSDATCIDKGKHSYAAVKADDANVFFIRDGAIWRLPRQ